MAHLVSSRAMRRDKPDNPPGHWTSRLTWGALALAILISLLLATGSLTRFQGWLIAGLVLAIIAFLVLGVIWERRSGASRVWRRKP